MGVTGLWRLIEPAGKPVPVETLENKVLAVGELTMHNNNSKYLITLQLTMYQLQLKLLYNFTRYLNMVASDGERLPRCKRRTSAQCSSDGTLPALV